MKCRFSSRCTRDVVFSSINYLESYGLTRCRIVRMFRFHGPSSLCSPSPLYPIPPLWEARMCVNYRMALRGSPNIEPYRWGEVGSHVGSKFWAVYRSQISPNQQVRRLSRCCVTHHYNPPTSFLLTGFVLLALSTIKAHNHLVKVCVPRESNKHENSSPVTSRFWAEMLSCK